MAWDAAARLEQDNDEEMDLDDESSSEEETRKWGGSVPGRAILHRDCEGAYRRLHYY